MKEYVVIPDSLLKKTPELAKYLKMSYDVRENPEAKTDQQENKFALVTSN